MDRIPQQPSSSASSTYGAVLINPTSPLLAGGTNHGNPDSDVSSKRNPSGSGHGHSDSHSYSSNSFNRQTPPRTPRLSFPWPLILAAALDASYIIHHTFFSHLSSSSRPSTPNEDSQPLNEPNALVLVLCAVRVIVLGMVCGCSKRWRSRGGWVAAATVASVGLAIWRDCVDQLTRRRVEGDKDESVFLYTTIAVAISEYLLFLLLLRLSPPSHRIQPLALRQPAIATQQAVPFAYTSADDPITPRSLRLRRYSTVTSPLAKASSHRACLSVDTTSHEYSSGIGFGGPNAAAGPSTLNMTPASMRAAAGLNTLSPGVPRFGQSPGGTGTSLGSSDPSGSHLSSTFSHGRQPGDELYPGQGMASGNEDDDDVDDEDEEEGENDDEDEYGYDSASSISESSIIDLPPPLEPQRINIVPPSISMRSNLAAALDSSPLLGPIVRRTRSARFLGRSFGSVVEHQDQEAEEGLARRMRAGAGRDEDGVEGAEGEVSEQGVGYGTFGTTPER